MPLDQFSPRRVLAGVTWAVILAACAAEPGGSALQHPTVDTLPGGAIHVVNHGPTEWADGSGWQLEFERKIVPADSGAAMLSSPRNVVATSRGEVVVLDRRPASIKVYSPTGDFLRAIGREGAGPGEYADFGELAIIGDTLVVNDRQHARIVLFDVGGSYLRTLAVASTPMWQVTTADGRIQLDTYLAQRKRTLDDSYAGSGVRRLRTDGSVADSFFYPPEPRGHLWTLIDASHDLGAFIPFSPGREKALSPSGQLIWGDQAAYRLVVTDNGHDTLRLIEAVAPAVPINDSLRRAERADVLKSSRWAEGSASLDEIPNTYPTWTELHVDPTGDLWVLRPGPGGPGAVLDVFAPDGRLRGSLPAPFPTFAYSYWSGDRIYRIGQGDDDLPQVEIWRIVRKPVVIWRIGSP